MLAQSSTYEPTDCQDLTPAKLAAFYRAVGGDYDTLFVETHPASIAFIYKALGCRHSLQPAAEDDDYATPSVPALKLKGFAMWQTIQLLLAPEEHVPFLQNAVSRFDITDPAQGTPFPKILPQEAFPAKPDDSMVEWYDGVSERLRREAEAEEQRGIPDARNVNRRERTSSDMTRDGSADERSDAADYFSNPLFRNREGRPAIVRHFSRKPQSSPRRFVQEQGRVVANTVRHIVSPHLWGGGGGANSSSSGGRRRSSLPDRYGDGDHDPDALYDDDSGGATPTGLHPRRATAHRPKPAVRLSSTSRFSSGSDSDSQSPGRRWQQQQQQHHHHQHQQNPSPRPRPRSYDPHRSSQDRHTPPYSGAAVNSSRPQSLRVPSEQRRPAERPVSASYGPSADPIFAARVQRRPPLAGHERRGSLPSRPTYGPTYGPTQSHSKNGGRYGPDESPGQRMEGVRIGGSYQGRSPSRERERDRVRERERNPNRDRSGLHRYVTPSMDGVGGRRYPVEAPWR